MQFLSLIN